MTINRDIWEDRKSTKERIYDRSKHRSTLTENWLGHVVSSGAAVVDEMLLDGEFAERIMAIDMPDGTVYRNFKNHRRHLWEAHGLRVVKDTSGKLMFDREDLKHEMPSREVRPKKRDRPKSTDRMPQQSGITRSISKTVQREVWRRDQGKCVECGSREKLEFDHIIPVSKGGSNTARNIQLLCEACNRGKSATIG